MHNIDYWLWLTLKDSLSADKITKLLEIFETPEQMYRAKRKTLAQTEGLSKKYVALLSDKDMSRVKEVKDRCQSLGARILTYDSPNYPEKLKNIYDPPYVLYIYSKQKINLNEKLCMAVVGNRRMTDYGRKAALDIAKGLAAAGVVVVSGMAEGIDGAAHTGALRVGGLTVAVLGSGLDHVFPREHEGLMHMIAEQGMVITEYPPGTKPESKNFPQRNRIISGLSDGTVVVEAPARSGSLITARYAYQQGRDVFAIPGDITRARSKGTHNLIRDGAILVTSALEILEEYEELYINTLKEYINNSRGAFQTADAETEELSPEIKAERYKNVSETAMKIIHALSSEPVSLELLQARTELSADVLAAELSMLEISGLITTLPGKNFILNV